jgi:nucleotide-binding universal stress UspA family protein
MDNTTQNSVHLRLVVGYDGTPPATRALDSAVSLLRGRTGSISVVYVGHVPGVDMLSAAAVAEVELDFGQIAEDLRKQAADQLAAHDELHWDFEQREGLIAQELLSAAQAAREAHPADTVIVVVGSSSHITHRVLGSVAVALARHAPFPLIIVP